MSNGEVAPAAADRRILWVLNASAAILVTVVFLLIVMTAIAQQDVIASIKQDQLSLGYSAALTVNNEARGINDELRGLRAEVRAISKQLRSDQVNFYAAQRDWEDSWDELQPFLNRLAKPCGIDMPKDSSFGARDAALDDLRQCLAASAGSKGSAPELAAAAEPAKNFAQVSARYRTAFDVFSTTKDKLNAALTQETATVLSDEEQKVSTSFSEMDVLLSNWMLAGSLLVLFPPALLQVLLTFVSGLFGAILVTLVLLVYPNSQLDITASKQTWARVLVGGLVALCVYVVLLGGTAVMGASSGLTGAGSNYMAFCGIGILAGMFSDRVAFWLSDRANAFFKRSAPVTTAAKR